MKIKTAIKKLSKLADGKYFSLEYKVSKFSSEKGFRVECQVYIDGQTHRSAGTWREAIKKMDNALNPKKHKVENIDESTSNKKALLNK